jgi:hypothetical protein
MDTTIRECPYCGEEIDLSYLGYYETPLGNFICEDCYISGYRNDYYENDMHNK